MRSIDTHAPLAIRTARMLARILGTPVGTIVVLALRMTSRRAGIALMYHSVAQRQGDPERELVPPHEAVLFERQMRLVRRHFRVVHAVELHQAALARRRGERFPVAITFDDDLACHAEVSAPILARLGLTGTYFLSGASLDRPFAFWYERLQRAFDENLPGLAEIVMGPSRSTEVCDLRQLGWHVEHLSPDARDEVARRLGDAVGPDPLEAGIRASQVGSLTDAGMTVGFHTRRHDSLTFLSDLALAQAMIDGRAELEVSAGAPTYVIGYPHGRADDRVARAAAEAGFTAGFTTDDTAVTPDTDPLLQGRVGPSLRSAGALSVQLMLTLLRAGSGQSTRAPRHPAS